MLGREGVDAEHNVAIGFFGEHLFYLPHAWILSAGLLVVTVVILRRGLWALCSPYRSVLIVFDVWLMTLFWGGMAAFAARVWFALLPLVTYVLVLKWLERSKSQGAVRPGEPLFLDVRTVGPAVTPSKLANERTLIDKGGSEWQSW